MIDKIQHYLSLLFITLLALLQSLIFIAVKADHNNLQVQYINPVVNQTITIGDRINIQALLSLDDEVNVSSVTFKVEQSDSSYIENFEAQEQEDSSYLSPSSWDTSNLTAGTYYITTLADSFDADGNLLEHYESNPQAFIIINSMFEVITYNVDIISPSNNQEVTGDTLLLSAISQAPINALFFNIVSDTGNYEETIIAEKLEEDRLSWRNDLDLASLTNGSYTISLSIIADNMDNFNIGDDVSFVLNNTPEEESSTPLEESESLIFDIISPTSNRLTGEVDITVQVSRDLSEDSDVYFNILFNNNEVERVDLEQVNDLIYSNSLDTTEYDNGEYTFVFYADEVGDTTNFSTRIFEFNNLEFPVSEINLITPSENSIILTYSFEVSLETNFDADNFNIELINISNPAITTGILPITRTDGSTWSKVLTLDPDIFINDEYKLITSAVHQANQETITNEFYFEIRLNDDWSEFSPEEVTLILDNPGSNLSDSVILLANSNSYDLEVYFVILNSTDEEEIERLPSIEVDRQYRAYWETADFENSNYYIYASSQIDGTLILTDRVLVTVFNEIEEEEEETIPEDEESSEEEGGIPPEEEEESSEEEGGIPPEEEEETIPSDITFNLDDSCIEAGITDEQECIQFQAIINNIDDRCLEQSIYDLISCEDYLNRLYIALECQEVDIINPEECEEYMLETYSSTVDCQLDDLEECNTVIRENHLSHLVLRKQEQDIITEIIEPLKGEAISLTELSNLLRDQGISTKVLPLESEDNVLIINSQKEIILEDKDTLSMINPGILMLDSDLDGLPNDVEEYYGTDIYNSDSDNDGYNDSEEVKNNYDPLNTGILEKERSNLDKIILSNTSLEQPKILSDKINEDFIIQEVDNIEEGTILTGKAEPNTWINIYLYSSLPLVMTTKTDESGNWSYAIKNPLTDGHHKVYVTINDDTGKITKQSSPLSFFVKEAKAVTANEYFDDNIVTDKVSNMLFYYIIAAIILISLGLGIILLVHKRSSNDTL